MKFKWTGTFFWSSSLSLFKGLVIERIGRKPLLIFGFTAMAVFFSLLTVFLNLQVSIWSDSACAEVLLRLKK